MSGTLCILCNYEFIKLNRIFSSYVHKNCNRVFILKNPGNILAKYVSLYLERFQRYGALKKYNFLGLPCTLRTSTKVFPSHMSPICTSLQADNQTNTSSLNFYRPDALSDDPTNSVQALEPKCFQLTTKSRSGSHCGTVTK